MIEKDFCNFLGFWIVRVEHMHLGRKATQIISRPSFNPRFREYSLCYFESFGEHRIRVYEVNSACKHLQAKNQNKKNATVFAEEQYSSPRIKRHPSRLRRLFSYSDQGDTVFSMIVIFSATLPTPCTELSQIMQRRLLSVRLVDDLE
ncbi:hypothetical protein CEXT_136571 [Caerostris extrusa]|uniref:Uncharacterized protein n=1 Tax=Caerostris extrusa TaxID=172846 RepID=A0AAV4X5Z3_CAEEX|nr:hypothetical protein CEXT_136571 [Caerostris extrusa]